MSNRIFHTFEDYRRAYANPAPEAIPELGAELAERHLNMVRQAVREWLEQHEAAAQEADDDES